MDFAATRFFIRLGLLFFALVVAMSSSAAFAQAIVSCSSDDMNYHTCSIPPGSRARVARQRSDAQCIEGQTFGVRGNQLWVDRGCRADFEIFSGRGWNNGGSVAGTITCSSDDMRRHYCNIAQGTRARLARQRSDAQCIEGQTWGQNGSQIWVDRGCRADFTLQAGGRRDRDWDRDWDRDDDRDHHDHDWDRDRDHDRDRDRDKYGSSRIVTCSSDNMRRRTCNVGSHGNIRMVRQRSDARCEFNRTYGFTGNSIWVDRGCRADFEVMNGRH
jgi:hypothetical protein